MKTLDVLGSGARKVVAAVAGAARAARGPAAAPRARDPFYSDLERREEINERGQARWLARRRGGWLR